MTELTGHIECSDLCVLSSLVERSFVELLNIRLQTLLVDTRTFTQSGQEGPNFRHYFQKSFFLKNKRYAFANGANTFSKDLKSQEY